MIRHKIVAGLSQGFRTVFSTYSNYFPHSSPCFRSHSALAFLLGLCHTFIAGECPLIADLKGAYPHRAGSAGEQNGALT